jgi:glycosyltransferase involved in cell wall biosynthesis
MIYAMVTSAKSPIAKVDVLLPYWGDFGLLKKAVESVLAQTEQNWRMLIVDDCYPSDEATKYFTDFPDVRISYTRHKKNLGLVGNFNYVLGQATADYCVIMGCDDIMLPKYLETALSKIGEADYLQPGVNIIDETDKVYLPMADRVKRFLRPKRSGIHSGEPVATTLGHGNWLYFPSIFWKTATLKRYGFDSIQHNTQDVIMELSIIRDGGSLYLDNEVTFLYRRSASSFSSKAKGGTRFSEENETYDRLAKQFHEMGWKKASRAAKLHATVRLHKLIS